MFCRMLTSVLEIMQTTQGARPPKDSGAEGARVGGCLWRRQDLIGDTTKPTTQTVELLGTQLSRTRHIPGTSSTCPPSQGISVVELATQNEGWGGTGRVDVHGQGQQAVSGQGGM